MVTYSIIIPTFGRPRFLAEALQSVLVQSIDDFEVIVVDDASPTAVEVPDDRRVRVVRAQHNGGPAAARNLGVQASRGEVLAFLDDDDTWLPNRLELAAVALEDAPVSVCWQAPSTGRRLDGAVHDTILDATTPNLGATAVHRSAWRALDGSYRAGEDLVWWLDVSEQAEVATRPAQGLVVRRHPGVRAGYGAEERIAASLRLLRDRDPYFATHPAAAAFRWKRIGLMESSLGRKTAARAAFLRALRLQPSLADAAHLLRGR
jgi:glycosyltransferase involved in cell wall biosynthesis